MDATQDSLLFLFPAATTLISPLLAVLVAAFSLLWLYPGGPAWALISRSRATPPGTPEVVTALAGPAAHRALSSLSQSLPGGAALSAFSVGLTRLVVASQPDTARELLASRRLPHQGRGAGAPLPPRHGLRPLRRLLARAAAHQLRVPLQPAQRVRDGPASCRHRRAHAAGPLGRAQRRGRHAARAPRGLPRPRHGHRVRRALRRRQPGGRGAGGDGEGRVRTTCSACSTGATTCRCSGGWTCKASGGGAGAW
uniref:Uncharacterized protein n=1 Tax=Zea mays TaxID=4577 RepID=A0A804UK26_MAIZE